MIKALAARLRSEIPGAGFSFTQPIIDNVTEAVTGSPADLAVILSGSDPRQLRKLGAEALAVLQNTPGHADTGFEREAEQAQLRIGIDRQSVARYGINVRDVQDVIELAIGGRPISTVFEGERRSDCNRQHPHPDPRGRACPAGAACPHRGGQRREHHRTA